MENCLKPYGSPFGPLPLQPKAGFCCFPSSFRSSIAFGIKGRNDHNDEMTPSFALAKAGKNDEILCS